MGILFRYFKKGLLYVITIGVIFFILSNLGLAFISTQNGFNFNIPHVGIILILYLIGTIMITGFVIEFVNKVIKK